MIYYLSVVLFWFRPALVDAGVKMYWEEIVISDAITRTVNLEMELLRSYRCVDVSPNAMCH